MPIKPHLKIKILKINIKIRRKRYFREKYSREKDRLIDRTTLELLLILKGVSSNLTINIFFLEKVVDKHVEIGAFCRVVKYLQFYFC